MLQRRRNPGANTACARLTALTASIVVAAALAGSALAQRGPESSSWVWRDHATGRLLYRTTPVGDRIPDFSGVGYLGGARTPDVDALVPAERRVVLAAPGKGDATAAIQAAIDAVSARTPDANGLRGVVQLAPGMHDIEDQLKIHTGGVVLRGHPKTYLRGTGTAERSLIVVGGRGGEWQEVPGSRSEVSDPYVPVGATSLRVQDPRPFRAGAEVIVLRRATAAWISAIGMDRIPQHRSGKKNEVRQWEPGGTFDQIYERTIVRVEGDRLFLDEPLTTSLDRAYGPSYVYRYGFPERIERVGLVELHAEATYDDSVRDRKGRPIDESHASTFISVARARHAWIHNVSGRHFSHSTVLLSRYAVRVTVRDAASYAPVSEVRGRRRYAFSNNGQLNLLHDLHSEEGRHDFVNNAPSRGPNVFLRGKATNGLAEVGPHQRWSTGTLYDRIEITGLRATLAAHNTGNNGNGHGHTGAYMVFWNSRAPVFRIENPPTAHNWAVGGQGEAIDPPDFLNTPIGTYDRHGAMVNLGESSRPEYSLYEAQRAEQERLRSRGGTRRVYLAGSHAAGADPKAGVNELGVDITRGAAEAIAGAVVRFAARRVAGGPPVLAVGTESLSGPAMVTAESAGVVTGTGVVPPSALAAFKAGTRTAVGVGANLRLLWVELEVDFVPAAGARPTGGANGNARRFHARAPTASAHPTTASTAAFRM